MLSSCGPGCCRVGFRCGLLSIVETRGLFGMATEQMAMMFGQLQQLSQQLVKQQQMFQQRQQPQGQMETLTNLGAAQVAKTTYDARDFQTKAFSKMKSFKGDEKAWPDWSGELVEQLMDRLLDDDTSESPTMHVLPSLASSTSGAAPLDASISRSTTATRMSATRTKASPHSTGALLVGTQWRPCAGPSPGH